MQAAQPAAVVEAAQQAAQQPVVEELPVLQELPPLAAGLPPPLAAGLPAALPRQLLLAGLPAWLCLSSKEQSRQLLQQLLVINQIVSKEFH
jgi:hypothetical protein